jgi:hypothetical protein
MSTANKTAGDNEPWKDGAPAAGQCKQVVRGATLVASSALSDVDGASHVGDCTSITVRNYRSPESVIPHLLPD